MFSHGRLVMDIQSMFIYPNYFVVSPEFTGYMTPCKKT